MARRYEIIVEWGVDGTESFDSQAYDCDSYHLTQQSNLLTMTNAIFGRSGFHSIGIPLNTVHRYVVVDRHQRRIDP
jgi:hypothetical protein